jgi:hypothetical protein
MQIPVTLWTREMPKQGGSVRLFDNAGRRHDPESLEYSLGDCDEQHSADHATHCAAAANRLGNQGPTVEINLRAPRHRCVGASKRTPIVGT